VQHGDPSIAHQGHVDAADRRRLLRHSEVEAEKAEIAADVDRSRGAEHETRHAVEQLLRLLASRGRSRTGRERPLGNPERRLECPSLRVGKEIEPAEQGKQQLVKAS
jgi:hypothetical protein